MKRPCYKLFFPVTWSLIITKGIIIYDLMYFLILQNLKTEPSLDEARSPFTDISIMDEETSEKVNHWIYYTGLSWKWCSICNLCFLLYSFFLVSLSFFYFLFFLSTESTCIMIMCLLPNKVSNYQQIFMKCYRGIIILNLCIC